MSAPPTNPKAPAAKPRPVGSAAGAPAPAPAKKKASTMSFMPTIPSSSAKVTGTATAGAGGAQPRTGGMKPISRPPGAPPGQFRSNRGPPGMGGPGGGKFGMGKPGFVPRGPAWVPVGSASIASTTGASSSGSSSAAAAAPKPEREKRQPKTFTQEDIAPTAQSMQIDPLNLAHPMTLPFLDPIKANPTLKNLSSSSTSGGSSMSHPGADVTPIANKSGSVRTMGIQAEISNPANLMFKTEDGEYAGEDQLFFIQLPSAVPIGNLPARPSVAVENTEILGFKGNLATINSGKIGKIIVYKSGKVKMKIGDRLFDVSTGLPCNFLQEVVAIDPDRQKLYQLGELQRRMVCYPDVADLLDDNVAKGSSDMELS